MYSAVRMFRYIVFDSPYCISVNIKYQSMTLGRNKCKSFLSNTGGHQFYAVYMYIGFQVCTYKMYNDYCFDAYMYGLVCVVKDRA